MKAVSITRAATSDTVSVDPPGDVEGETVITLTNAQKALIFSRRAAAIQEIKTLANGLPNQ